MRRLSLVGLVVLLGGLASASALRAQQGGIQPLCGSGCHPYSVAVTPAGTPTAAALNSSGHVVSFTVINNGTNADEYTLTCPVTGGITCTNLSTTDLPLSAGDSSHVQATFSVGSSYGNIELQANGSEGQPPASGLGWYVVIGGSPVSVTPVSGADTVQANGALDSVTFQVKNTGSQYSDTYNLTATCTNLTCQLAKFTNPNPKGPLTLGPGNSSTVWVKFYHPSSSGNGSVSLEAADSAFNFYATGSSTINARVTPTGPLVARDLCLTIAVGPSAAYECGDLRIVHPLPSVRTLGKARTPTLFYNSQQAHPFLSLNDDLTLAANDRPDSIIASVNVKVGSYWMVGDREVWVGAQWGSASQAATRRLMTITTVNSYPTGLYPYQFNIVQWVNGVGYRTIRTDTGTATVVNRFASPFGAGWWLAGFEQILFPADSSIMWIGGDGSVRRYVKAGTWSSKTWYVARALDGPDTLSFDSTTYTRHLKGGVKVLFNTSGFHTQTVSRLGYATVFAPDGSNRLSTITVPPAGAGLTYTFTYGGPNGTLSAVAAPDSAGGSGRVTTVSGTLLTGGAKIASIADPGITTAVQFSYGNGSYPAAITARTDRRGNTTTYLLGTGLKLVGDSLPVPGAQTIRRTFCPAEVRVFVCGSGLTAPESTYTIYDGPRTMAGDSADISHFWLDTLGAVTRVRDAYNNVTTVTRGDSRWPGLATQVLTPDGRNVAATYDARGNQVSTTDSSKYASGVHATTSYGWDGTWDQLTQITAPTGEVTQFGVSTYNGNRLWVQDGRGTPSRTTFGYVTSGNGAGLVDSITQPGGALASLTYDNLGNAASSVSEVGWTMTFASDRLGRIRVTQTPVGPTTSSQNYRTDTTAYDVSDRVIRSASVGASLNGISAQTLTVRTWYNEESGVDSVARSQWPNPTGLNTLVTKWIRDAANRPIRETAPDGYSDSTSYDAAGNVTQSRTRRCHVITMTYDRMNRLRSRIVPGVTYAQRTGPGWISSSVTLDGDPSGSHHPYPWFPNNGNGFQLDSVVDTYTYDVMGRLAAANNGDAHVARTWFKDGNAASETDSIRNYSGSTFGHVYALRYTYDLSGRLTALHHPAQLAGGADRDSVRYVYDPTTGFLSRVYGLLAGDSAGFVYDNRSQLIRSAWPGSVSDSLGYDDMGRMTLDRVNSGATSLRNATVHYTDPTRVDVVRNYAGWQDTVWAAYSGLGHLVSHIFARPYNPAWNVLTNDVITESYRFDPLGNADTSMNSNTNGKNYFALSGYWSSEVWTNAAQYYVAATGRLDSTTDASGVYHFVYDSTGNTVFNYQAPAGSSATDRVSYYGADNMLRAAELRTAWITGGGVWSDARWKLSFEEYRYDALGRRVLVMDRRRCWVDSHDNDLHDYCNLSRVRRTVWDGARELWEIQMPADSLAGSSIVENDTAAINYWAGSTRDPLDYWGSVWLDPNPLFGRVAYTYVGGLDHPAMITRLKLVRRKSGDGGTYTAFAPLEVTPLWNWRGMADLGTFQGGGRASCADTHHCTWPAWREEDFHFGYTSDETTFETATITGDTTVAWFGTLIVGKEDGAGTRYSRNRYLDPISGRFTQEDPIGLAGGINLYGFAGGDPVNYADPFGLCPDGDLACALLKAAAQVTGGILGSIGGAAIGLAAGAEGGPAAAVTSVAGAVSFGASTAIASGKLVDMAFARSRHDLPARGEPNSSKVKDDGKGHGQIRDYGEDGRAKTDYDFGNDHNGAGDPHAHDWDWSKGGRQPARPVRPDETQP